MTAFAEMLANLDPATTSTSGPSELEVVDGTLYFPLNSSSQGTELWKTDGTAGGTSQVKDIFPGTSSSSPTKLTNVNGKLFFTARTSVNGDELWMSDGTAEGTTLVKDINLGTSGSSISNMSAAGGLLFFVANDGVHGSEWWRSDGTAEGTFLLADVRDGSSSMLMHAGAFGTAGGKLFFSPWFASTGQDELWVSDGTVAGTKVIGGHLPGEMGNEPLNFVDVNGIAYFQANVDSTIDTELWRSDGTPAGTQLLKVIETGVGWGSNPANLVNVNGTLYFVASDDGSDRELYKSDGTNSGTALVEEIAPSGSSNASLLTNAGGKLYFRATDGVNGEEMWTSDGTPEGTYLIKDINSGSGTSGVTRIAAANGKVYFTANDNLGAGLELWRTDGTQGNAARVTDLNTVGNSDIVELTDLGSQLYFLGNDGVDGREIWRVVTRGPRFTDIPDAVTYTENAPPTLLAPAAILADPDNTSFDGGTLTVALSANAIPADALAVRNEGSSPGQIDTLGDQVRYGGLPFGNLSGGIGINPLIIALNQDATLEAVQALLRNLTFESPGEEPLAGARTVSITLADGTGEINLPQQSQITVVSVNDLPELAIDAIASYVENAAPVALTPTATVSDLDSTFSGGQLTVTITENQSADDRLAVRNTGSAAGQIGVSGTSITFGGTAIGTLASTPGESPLVVNLNESVSPEGLQALLREVTFEVIGEQPVAGQRIVSIVVNDGEGGDSAAQTMTVDVIAVNDPLTVTTRGGFDYLEQSGVVLVDEMAALSDPDTAGFGAGKVTVTLSGEIADGDVLIICRQGLEAGQIGVSGDAVSYGGVIFGIVSGGVAGAPLNVALNGSATLTAIEALLQNIGFETPGEIFVPSSREVTIVVTAGDGETSNAAVTNIAVLPVNDAPVIVTLGSKIYVEDATPILVAPTAVMSDVDDAAFANGELRVTSSGIVPWDSHLAIRRAGYKSWQITTRDKVEVLYGGVLIGTYSGGQFGEPLVIVLNENATTAAVQALMRAVTYRSVDDGPSVRTRSVWFVLMDGQGATSAIASVDISIQPVNDAPVVELSGNPRYVENDAAPVPAIGSVAVLDSDQLRFGGGRLRVWISVGETLADHLTLPGEGNGVGQISAADGVISFEGVPIGQRLSNTPDNNIVIDLNTNASATALEALLQAVRFSVSGERVATSARSIAVTLDDGQGGTSAFAELALRVVGINDAPALRFLQSELRPVQMNVTNPAGTSVVELLGISVRDDDGEGALKGIAVTTASNFHGAWEYSLNKGLGWAAMGSPQETAARLLPGWAKVRFIPKAGFDGEVKLFYRAWDQTQGAVGGLFNLVGSLGGSKAFSIEKGAATQNVNASPRIGLSGTIGYVHDGPAVRLAPFASLTDADSFDFWGGWLRVRITEGADASNRVAIGGDFAVDENNNVIFGGFQSVGQLVSNGTGNKELSVRLGRFANQTLVRELIRSITFQTVGGAVGKRTVVFSVSDGDGALSNEATKNVQVTLALMDVQAAPPGL